MMSEVSVASKIILATILLFSLVTLASAGAPVLPSEFYGTISIDGQPASAGTLIDHNFYDARFIRLDQKFYSPKTFADYQRATGQDKASRWMKVEFKQPFDGQLAKPAHGKGVGVDMSRLPSAMR